MKISERALDLWQASRHKDRHERDLDECTLQALDEWQASVEERIARLRLGACPMSPMGPEVYVGSGSTAEEVRRVEGLEGSLGVTTPARFDEEKPPTPATSGIGPDEPWNHWCSSPCGVCGRM